jgi:hypothetical protein
MHTHVFPKVQDIDSNTIQKIMMLITFLLISLPFFPILLIDRDIYICVFTARTLTALFVYPSFLPTVLVLLLDLQIDPSVFLENVDSSVIMACGVSTCAGRGLGGWNLRSGTREC